MDLMTHSSSMAPRTADRLATAIRSMQRILITANPAESLGELLAHCAQALRPAAVALYRVAAEPPDSGKTVLELDRARTPIGIFGADDDLVSALVTGSRYDVVRQGESMLVEVDDLADDERSRYERAGWRSLLVIPIIAGNEFAGLLVCASERDAGNWIEASRALCDIIATAIGIVTLREKTAHSDRLLAAQEYSSDLISVVEPDGTLISCTQRSARVLGGSVRAHGPRAFDAVHPEDQPRVRRVLAELTSEPGGQRRMELRLKQAGGRWRHFEAVASNQIHNPLIGGIVVTAHDDTERKVLEEQLNWQVLHDPLTNLPNRVLLINDLRRALARSERTGEKIGLLYLDLDGFKQVNDHFGHSAGDELLGRIGERLRVCVRAGETVARLGGDEFIILLEGLTSPRDAEQAASRILDAVRIPVLLNCGTVALTASAGIAIAPSEAIDADVLLSEADAALYAAKQAGRNQYQMHETRQIG